MSCYFRHMNDVFEELGIEINKDNKKEVDKAIHKLVNVEYKNCPDTWKKVKEIINGDGEDNSKKKDFIDRLKKELQKV
ncbi:MAG: hypothetical protein M1479_03520 [Actinobacteria bacterium]|nr:hypothetical protein [Cyanobacteriota bacterium]MCL5771327.1 hypothetical protein [Actinomycetota bacterium]